MVTVISLEKNLYQKKINYITPIPYLTPTYETFGTVDRDILLYLHLLQRCGKSHAHLMHGSEVTYIFIQCQLDSGKMNF